jgi:flagellar basal-body rod modification protein FlgD
MTSQSISSLTSTTASTATYTTSSSNDEMSKTDFLTLLITQLQNQDPTNPQDSSEFASQLAQFSSLEQLMNLNDSLTTLQTSSDASAANALIGKDVLYDGDTLSIATSGSTPDAINFALSADASTTTIKIYNSDGDLVRTIDAGAQNGGTDSVSWDGLDSSGNALAAGDYTFTVTATDSSGTAVTSATLIREEVIGVMLSDSTYYLSTESGTLVTQDAVYEVMDHA